MNKMMRYMALCCIVLQCGVGMTLGATNVAWVYMSNPGTSALLMEQMKEELFPEIKSNTVEGLDFSLDWISGKDWQDTSNMAWTAGVTLEEEAELMEAILLDAKVSTAESSTKADGGISSINRVNRDYAQYRKAHASRESINSDLEYTFHDVLYGNNIEKAKVGGITVTKSGKFNVYIKTNKDGTSPRMVAMTESEMKGMRDDESNYLLIYTVDGFEYDDYSGISPIPLYSE